MEKREIKIPGKFNFLTENIAMQYKLNINFDFHREQNRTTFEATS